MNARALLALAGWVAVGASFGAVWWLTTGALPPWWATLWFGGSVFAFEATVGARLRKRGGR